MNNVVAFPLFKAHTYTYIDYFLPDWGPYRVTVTFGAPE